MVFVSGRVCLSPATRGSPQLCQVFNRVQKELKGSLLWVGLGPWGCGLTEGAGSGMCCCRMPRRVSRCSLGMLKVTAQGADGIWQLVLLSPAGSLRAVCVLKGWEWARELVWEAERRIPSLPAQLTCSFCAPQDRGLPGKLEPVSPVSPAHPEAELDLLPARLSKEELIQNMDRVDREITMVEQQISKLKKKQVGGWAL